MKKQPVVRLLLLLVVALAIFLTDHNADASRTPKGKDEVKIDDQFQSVLDHDYLETTSGDISDTIGTPDRCDDGDGACMKRRMMSEAHLDYIYTQHQEP